MAKQYAVYQESGKSINVVRILTKEEYDDELAELNEMTRDEALAYQERYYGRGRIKYAPYTERQKVGDKILR
jgi:hypothetical protein